MIVYLFSRSTTLSTSSSSRHFRSQSSLLLAVSDGDAFTSINHLQTQHAATAPAFQRTLKQHLGYLWSDFTDHLPNYVLIFNNALHHNGASDRPFVRLYSEQNISLFKQKLKDVDWNLVFNSNNVNEGYNYFECKFKECFVTVSSL